MQRELNIAVRMPRAGAPADARRSTTYQPLVLLFAAVALGIAADRFLSWPAEAWWAGGISGLAIWAAWLVAKRTAISSAILLATAAAAGGAWHHVVWSIYPASEISRALDETLRPIVVEATAITAPRWSPAPPSTPLRTIPRGEFSETLLWITAVRDGADYRPATGWATLLTDGPPLSTQSGDRVRIFAQGSRPAAPLNPGEFDYAAHERRQRIGCRLFAESTESVVLLAPGHRLNPRRWLARLRSGGISILQRYIAAERTGLASAILLGAREQLDADRNEGFLVTGTIHVLSVSGLHVGILAASLMLVLRTGLLPRWLVTLTVALLTGGYALLVDLEPPVVRATILITLTCVAVLVRRQALGFNALAAAALVVLAMNPASLFQAGPQLSFLAVATLIAGQRWLAPAAPDDPLDRLIARTRPWPLRAWRRLASFCWRVWLAGALIWLTSTPLVWSQYNLLSPVALVVNFLLWIPVTAVMYCGIATLLLGSWLPSAATVTGKLCNLALGVVEKIVTWGESLPADHIWWAAPPPAWIALFYVGLGLFVALPAWRPPRRWVAALCVAWVAGACLLSDHQSWNMVARSRQGELRCDFVAVGHGLCVLVELPDGKTLLYDAGRLGSPLAGVRPISALLWSRGINHLDCLVISHADADHYNAIPDLLERFSLGVVYVSPVMFRRLPDALAALHRAIDERRIPLREISLGQRLAGGGATIEVLHPPPSGVTGTDNANSLTLLLEYGGRRVLLTGDLEPPGLGHLLSRPALDTDVVLAPHHGSPRSNPGGFAEWCRPEVVVMSAGKALGDIATLQRVKDSLRLRGAEVYHTAEDGCTTVRIGPSGELQVTSFRGHVR